MITLSTVNHILVEISSLCDLEQDEFLNHVIEIIHAHIDIYFLKFFLLDSESKQFSFRAGTPGEVTNVLRMKGYWAAPAFCSINKIRMSSDYVFIYLLPTEPPNNLDIRLVSGPDPNLISPLLPDTRSQLSLPLRFEENLIGLWWTNSTEVNAFELNDIIHFQLLADQIAVRLYSLRGQEQSFTNQGDDPRF